MFRCIYVVATREGLIVYVVAWLSRHTPRQANVVDLVSLLILTPDVLRRLSGTRKHKDRTEISGTMSLLFLRKMSPHVIGSDIVRTSKSRAYYISCLCIGYDIVAKYTLGNFVSTTSRPK